MAINFIGKNIRLLGYQCKSGQNQKQRQIEKDTEIWHRVSSIALISGKWNK